MGVVWAAACAGGKNEPAVRDADPGAGGGLDAEATADVARAPTDAPVGAASDVPAAALDLGLELDAASKDAPVDAAAADVSANAGSEVGPRDTAADRMATDARVRLGAPCETETGEMLPCNTGLLCCKPCCDGRPAVCTRPVMNTAGIGNGKCPLPDLTVDARALEAHLGVGPVTFSPASCEAREQCSDASGVRKTLHFEVTTPNIGTSDLVLGSPLGPAQKLGEGFAYARCHSHYHFNGYALYQLLDQTGKEVLQGKKRAFCLEDYEPLETPPLGQPQTAQFDCDNQGISMGWQDTYANGLSCQFIDVTDLPAGRYTLRVTVNPDHVFPELSYANNVAEVTFDLGTAAARPTDPCEGAVPGGTRECGWRKAGTHDCMPGARVSAGCGAECKLGTAVGDPMIRVCEGEGECAWPGLGTNDDCTPAMRALGAAVNFICPPSGRFTVLTGPSLSDETAICNIAIR